MKKHWNKLALIVILGSGFALAQNTPDQTPPPQQPSTAQDQGKNPPNAPETLPNTDQKPSDQKQPQSDAAPVAAGSGDVQGTIQSAIQKDPSLSGSNVDVAVNGTTVELSGTVPTQEAKDAAERIAKENSGGMKVKSHIKVAADKMPK